MYQSKYKLLDRVLITKDGETYRAVIAGVTRGASRYDLQRDGVLSGTGREHDVDVRYIRHSGRPVLVKGVA